METVVKFLDGESFAVRERANCRGRRVGAIAVKDHRIISTGYNGTPEGLTNCLDGGCARCADRDQFESGTHYDLCICVHADQNAILSAACFGIATEGALMYSTMRPCFGCTKEMLQAKVRKVCYLHDWAHPDLEIHDIEVKNTGFSLVNDQPRKDEEAEISFTVKNVVQ